MTASSEIVGVIAGVALVLLAATVVGRTLAFWPGPQESNATVANLNARLDAWWMMLALIALAFAFGRRGVIVLFAILSFAALREFMTLTRLGAEDRWALIVAFFVAVPLQYCLVWIGWYGLYAILIPVYAFVLMPILATLRGQPKAFLDRVAHAQWGVMLTVYCVSHVPALATLQIAGYEGREILLIAYFLLVVQSSDVFQYVWGKLFGKTPIAPTLSPSKTLEGTLLGVASAVALGTTLWWITPFTPWQAGVVSLATTAMGFLGGLVLSAIKRDRGVKHWGWMIRGHGGVLDRLDSVAFSAPVFFHITRYWWAN